MAPQERATGIFATPEDSRVVKKSDIQGLITDSKQLGRELHELTQPVEKPTAMRDLLRRDGPVPVETKENLHAMPRNPITMAYEPVPKPAVA